MHNLHGFLLFFLLRTSVADCEATLALALNVSAYGEIQITEISNSKRVTYNIKYHYVVDPDPNCNFILFSNLVDPDPYSESRSGSTQEKLRLLKKFYNYCKKKLASKLIT